jgi:hypothetical protein
MVSCRPVFGPIYREPRPVPQRRRQVVRQPNFIFYKQNPHFYVISPQPPLSLQKG